METVKAAIQQHEQQGKQPQQVQQKRPQQVGGEEDRGGRRHFHVLAVDDSKIDRKILEQLLTVSSYQVTSVESGDKALEYLGLVENPPPAASSQQQQQQQMQEQGVRVNLIMTDYSMPGMSGYDLLKRVKGSLWKDVPVVVMSSENVPSRIHMCLEEGAEEFLLKPVQLSDLKKLQPYITRSKTHYCCANNNCNEEDQEGLELTMENSDNRKGGEISSIDKYGDSKVEETSIEMDQQDKRISPNNKINVEGLAVV